MKKIIAIISVSVLTVVTFFIIQTQTASAGTSNLWEVRVKGCHGGLSLYRSEKLAKASQYEVHYIRKQIHYRGIVSVRLFRVNTGNGAWQFRRISASVIDC